MTSVLKLGCHLCKKVENVPKKANLRRHYKLVHDIVLPAGKQKQTSKVNAIPSQPWIHLSILPEYFWINWRPRYSFGEPHHHVRKRFINIRINGTQNTFPVDFYSSVLDTPNGGDGLAPTNSLGVSVSIIDLRLPHFSVSKPITVVTQSRTYDEAVLHACNISNASNQEKCKTFYVVDSLSSRPFSHVDANGCEENGLASQRLVNEMSGEYQAIKSILPLKRSFESMNANICINYSPEIVPALTDIIAIQQTLHAASVYVVDSWCVRNHQQELGFFSTNQVRHGPDIRRNHCIQHKKMCKQLCLILSKHTAARNRLIHTTNHLASSNDSPSRRHCLHQEIFLTQIFGQSHWTHRKAVNWSLEH